MDKKDKDLKPEKDQEHLKGLNININEFGEIISSLEVEDINAFLNENVDDKKLRSQKDEEE